CSGSVYVAFGIIDLIFLGLGAITLGALIVWGLTYSDLGPASHLQGHRRVFLATAVGSGVLAFWAKLMVILGLINLVGLPEQSMDILPARNLDSAYSAPHYRWAKLPDNNTSQGLPRDRDSVGHYVWQALPETAPSPDGNPTTAEKVALGKRLFNDPNLSADGSMSCASCHDLIHAAGGDGRATAQGIEGRVGSRNTPTIWNAAFQSRLFWDGRALSLEQQAIGPLINPLEMAMPSLAAVRDYVASQPTYQQSFARAFGEGVRIDMERITQALAAYERTLITPDTPYDRYVRGELDALTDAQLRGMALFESTGCVSCHFGPNFSAASVFDDQAPLRVFPANPTPMEQAFDLLDQAQVASLGGRPVWRVPSLRNVALTGPWLHNGSVDKLEDVVRIMASAQLGWSGHYLLWSSETRTLREVDRPQPSDEQVADIVAFLHALSSDALSKQPGKL
ncbi:MAG: cytochrome-c peroxidase, partial [Gammaproteobacteria bacterium]